MLVFMFKYSIRQLSKEEVLCSFPLTFLIIFIGVQPEVLQTTLKMVVCRTILGNQYTLEDSYIKCTDDYYNNFILPINIFIFLLMSILIPSYFIIQLRIKSKEKQLEKVKIRRIYGYFYNELKLDKFYWDFILMAAVPFQVLNFYL